MVFDPISLGAIFLVAKGAQKVIERIERNNRPTITFEPSNSYTAPTSSSISSGSSRPATRRITTPDDSPPIPEPQPANPRFTRFARTGLRAPLKKQAHELKPQNTIYASLPLAANDIRILVLKPRGRNEPALRIKCDLKVATTATEYEALSYTWGDPDDTVPVVINERNFWVTRNLRDALVELRPPPGSRRVLWVDAICINQNNRKEKNAQVPRMCDIYTNAQRVFVWLGCSTPDSNSAIDFFSRRSHAQLQTSDMAHWREFGRGVLEREWWKRIWIIQEIVLARDIVVYCGKASFPWEFLTKIVAESFEKNVNIFDYNSPQSLSYTGFHYAAIAFEGTRASYQRLGPRPLPQLLTRFAKHKSSLGVDRIYGMLGIAASLGEYEIEVDYDTNPSVVFMEVTQRIILVEKSLDIIAAGRGSISGRMPGLASWAPDFRIQPGQDPASITQLNVPETPGFSASKSAPPIVDFLTDGTMRAIGVHAGVIDEVSMALNIGATGDVGEDPGEHNANALKGALELGLGGPGYPRFNARYPFSHGQTFREAVSRVLVCDTNAHNERCADGEGFFQQDTPPPRNFEPGLDQPARRDAWEMKVGLMRTHWRERRRFTVTNEGALGLVPEDAAEGDWIVILLGCSVPLVMRPHKLGENKYQFTLIGACYIHGIMDGQFMDIDPENMAFDII